MKVKIPKLARSLGALLVSSTAAAALNFVSFTLIARALSRDGMGAYALARGVFGIVVALSTIQSGLALIRYGAEAKAAMDGGRIARLTKVALMLDTLVGLAGCGVGAVVVLLAGEQIGIPGSLKGWVAVYLLGVPFVIQGAPSAILRVYDRYSLLSVGLIAAAVVRMVAVVATVVLGSGAKHFLACSLFADVAQGAILLTLMARVLWSQSGAGWWKQSTHGVLKQNPGLLRFAVATNLQATIKKVVSESDVVLIGGFAGLAAAGEFKVAKQLGVLAAKILGPMYDVLYPELATRLSRGAHSSAWRLTWLATLAASLVALFPWLLVQLAGPVVINLYVGDSYLESAPVFAWVLLAFAGAHAGIPMVRFLLAAGATRGWIVVTIVLAILYLAALPVIATDFGGKGAAMLQCVHNLGMAIAVFLLGASVRRNLRGAARA